MDTKIQKRAVYNDYQEYFMNGQEIKEYFKNSCECFGKHHEQISSYSFSEEKFKKYFPRIKDNVIYRVFFE